MLLSVSQIKVDITIYKMCILKKNLRKPICDIVFRIRYFELCICVLTFEQKLHMGRMS